MHVNEGRLWDHLRVLGEEIGPRLSGTPADGRSVEYMAPHMRRCGVQVEVQDYSCPGWDHESTELTLTTDAGAERVPAFAQTFSLACEVEGEIACVRTRDELEFSPDLEGKVLVLCDRLATSLAADRNPALLTCEERGAAAVIPISPAETVSTKLIRDPWLRVPAAAVARSVGERLQASQGARARLRVGTHRYDSTSHNVIGRLPGEQEGHIAVAAHYDTAAGSPGAVDNASGTAVVLELCELFAAEGCRDLGIDFIAYGAEEYGRNGYNLGAVEYVRRHPLEVSQTRALVEIDCVGTAAIPPRVRVNGLGPEQREVVLEALGRFPRYDIEVLPETEPVHTALNLPGVPALAFINDYTQAPIHTAQDTIDLMDPGELALTAEAVAAVVQCLSLAP